MKENRKNYLIVDFDSTFVKLEALDNLARIALENNQNKEKILEEIEATTKLGMEGKITFPESLSRRLGLFSVNREHIKRLTDKLKENISDSTKRNSEFFRNNADNIFIISGGFIDYIYPIVGKYGISERHVLANKFCIDDQGNVTGIEMENFLAQEEGKAKAVDALGLKGKIWVIGDGYTDFEIKKKGSADTFIAFIENVKRSGVVEKADYIASSFDEALKFIKESKTKKINS